MISDLRAIAEFLLLSATLLVVTWLASLVSLDLPPPSRHARVRFA